MLKYSETLFCWDKKLKSQNLWGVLFKGRNAYTYISKKSFDSTFWKNILIKSIKYWILITISVRRVKSFLKRHLTFKSSTKQENKNYLGKEHLNIFYEYKFFFPSFTSISVEQLFLIAVAACYTYIFIIEI